MVVENLPIGREKRESEVEKGCGSGNRNSQLSSDCYTGESRVGRVGTGRSDEHCTGTVSARQALAKVSKAVYHQLAKGVAHHG